MDPGSLLLPPAALRLPCRPEDLDAASGDESGARDPTGLEDPALEALEVGLSVRGAGFHVYVAGPPGTGRRTAVTAMLERVAARLPVPSDRVHVPRFDDPRRPRLVTLEAGRGVRFGALVEEFSRALALRAGTLLEDRGVERRREALVHRFRTEEEARLADLRARLARVDVALVVDESSTPQPFEVIPTQDGAPASVERIEEERGPEAAAAVRETLGHALTALREHLREARARRRSLDEQLRGTYERAARTVVDEELPLIADEFSGPVVDVFLADVRLDAIDGLADYAEGGSDAASRLQARLQRYGPALSADRTGELHAPVVVDEAPSRESLFGTIPAAHDGPIGSVVDLSRMTTGSVLRADGGFLILDVEDLLAEPGAWPLLRRVLRSGRYEAGVGAPRAIEPEGVPVDVKLILIGARERYDELAGTDEIFRKSFGVRADFGRDTPRTRAAERWFARVAAEVAQAAGLMAVSVDGLAAVVEVGAELTGRRDRLTTGFAAVERVLREAAFRAERRGAGAVERIDVVAARTAQLGRDDPDVDLAGLARLVAGVGLGPGRSLALEPADPRPDAPGGVLGVTAVATTGPVGAVRVERSAQADRPEPDPATLVLAALLRSRYPGVGLTATLALEDLTGVVSSVSGPATLAELVAVVSAIVGVPVDPSLAIAGTVDLHGEVGPAAGVGARLRRLHRATSRAGDDGGRAVAVRGAVVPAAQVATLMLPDALVDDAAAGRFAVHAVARADEALELLLGTPVEEIDRRVLDRLEGRTPAEI